MERFARARFKVIRVNRWTLALILIAVLGLLLLPIGRNLPAGGSFTSTTIAQGVTVGNRDFSGKTQAEARTMLKAMSRQFESAPIMAQENPDAAGISYVVPEVNGSSLDIDTTWFRLATAAAGTEVAPARMAKVPAKTTADYPLSVIKQGNGHKNTIALLVNVDWGTEELAQMLPLLQKHGVKVTLFVSGRWADANKALLKRIAGEGHEVATHGYDLSSGPKVLAASGKLRADIARSVTTIQGITGLPVRYYAPHQSEIDQEILKTAADLKLRTVLYSLDTKDWMDSVTEAVILQRLHNVVAGDIILMHPKPHTVTALDQALTEFTRRGLRPVTLSELLSPEPGGLSGAAPGGQHP